MNNILDEEFVDNSYFTVEEEVIGEGENAQKQMCFRGILSEANSINGNRRVYPKEVLREVFMEAKAKAEKTGQPVFGELEHANSSHINLERIAVTFPEFTWDEEKGQIIGKAVPTLTEAGKTVAGLAKSGFKICFSTRMTGKTKPMTEERKRQFNITEDCSEVLPGARLISIDIVGNPSCQKAITDTVYEEKQEEKPENKKTFKDIFDNIIK